MSFTSWLFFAGLLFLAMALSSALLRPAPVSSAMLYLLVGVLLGPLGVAALSFDAVADADWFERTTEVAVLVSLFVSGMKLRLPLRDPAWRAAYLLAGPVMVGTIAAVALFSWWVFGLSVGESMLLGAVLAPTDPVLAAEAKVASARDRDRLRYALSGEAGLNDGTAFPFVVFALMWIANEGRSESWMTSWALERLLWAVPAGLIIGFIIGYFAGKATTTLHARYPRAPGLNDFLVLALIALSYTVAEGLHAWGFLAAFAAGVGLRRAEVDVVRHRPPPRDVRALEADVKASDPSAETPAEAVVERDLTDEARRHPAVAAGEMMSEASSFGDALERLAEVVVVVLLGVMVSARFDPRGVLLAAALFMFVRPAMVWIGLLGSPTTRTQRAIIGWLGIRGAGTIYYLAYAIGEGLGRAGPSDVTGLALTTVVASIIVHGLTATPILRWYQRHIERG